MTSDKNPNSDDAPLDDGGHHGWTLILICAGIGLLACCLLIPQTDENRRLVYEAQKFKNELDYLQKQVQVNAEFIQRVGEDPILAERLAQRQMKFIREGASVVHLDPPVGLSERTPYSLVSLAPPSPPPAYRLPGGRLAELCRDPKSRLYLIGLGLMLTASGLVLGSTPPTRSTPQAQG